MNYFRIAALGKKVKGPETNLFSQFHWLAMTRSLKKGMEPTGAKPKLLLSG